MVFPSVSPQTGCCWASATSRLGLGVGWILVAPAFAAFSCVWNAPCSTSDPHQQKSWPWSDRGGSCRQREVMQRLGRGKYFVFSPLPLGLVPIWCAICSRSCTDSTALCMRMGDRPFLHLAQYCLSDIRSHRFFSHYLQFEQDNLGHSIGGKCKETFMLIKSTKIL